MVAAQQSADLICYKLQFKEEASYSELQQLHSEEVLNLHIKPQEEEALFLEIPFLGP